MMGFLLGLAKGYTERMTARRRTPIRFGNGKRNAKAQIGSQAYHSSLVELSEFGCDVHKDDAKAREKDNALHSALSELASEFGRESMLSMSHFFGSRYGPVISTGLLKLDLALGIGGLPKGRFVEIFGHEGSGKTTLAIHIIKEAQKNGGYCAYFDAENSLNESLLDFVGVDSEKLLIANANSGENLLSMAHTLTKSNSVDVIVVDSVAALIPGRELDEPVGSITTNLQSLMMTQALRKINQSLCQTGTVVIFLNQVRANVKSGRDIGHTDEVTCGGNALRFYAAVRMRVVIKGFLKTDDKVTGLRVCVQVVKNKLAPAMRNAELALHFGSGFSSDSQVACEHGMVSIKGE